MMLGAFVLPLVSVGMMEASAIRSPSMPCTFSRSLTTARGSVAESPPMLDVADVSWDQDATGTVTLAGSVVATAPVEFVSVVGLLRDRDGGFMGTAFAFVSAVTPDQPQRFEALGFPAGDVAAVDLYVNG